MTISERVMWHALRDRRLAGLKFRRQHRIGKFVVDFYCARYRLVIELDGEPHMSFDGISRDTTRDAELRAAGMHVLRFENRMIALQREYVVAGILRTVAEIESRTGA